MEKLYGVPIMVVESDIIKVVITGRGFYERVGLQ